MIKKLLEKNKLRLAPMAGVTNSPYREICLLNDAGFVTTEEIDATSLVYNQSNRTKEISSFYKREKPIAMQLLGCDPKIMSEASVILQDMGADIIDINMGCPVPKITKKGKGSALMKDISETSKLVKTMRQATKIPLTAKIRSGWNDENENALEFSKMLEDEGIDSITIHPRTRNQRYAGLSKWEIIKKIVDEGNPKSNSTVVFEESWNKGVIGIVASRIIEKHYKPTIVFCMSKDGNLTGSARSIHGVDLYEILQECKASILQFGGHKYAAGLTIEKENFKIFKTSFEKAVKNYVKNKLPVKEIKIESKIILNSITPKFFRILNQFEPFGPENKRPIFLSENLNLKGELNKIGKNREHLKLSVSQESDKTFSAIGFWLSEKATSISPNSTFSMLYTIDENTWNGITSIQLKIKDIK